MSLSCSLPHSSAGRLCLFRALRYQHLLESSQDIFSCFLDFMWYYQDTISKRGDSLCPPAATPNLPVSSAEARQAAGLTQLELAEKLGVTIGTIGYYERGAGMPKTDNLFALCDILHIRPADLLRADS